eukprot:TRINITY_DN716_c0_g1_i1.p1 TRINITY_DN716_c0_g1~~TRINITY_DN716_c0_g1_i1.p1  ORF type:complete len:653 (-),score=133.46 TRINITY_DN716_c0_g1_i1:155-2068(-)
MLLALLLGLSFFATLGNQLLLSVSPSFIQVDRTNVTVWWKGVENPTEEDWIGLYTPVTADFVHRTPVKLKMCTESSTHLVNGTGSLNFSLLNMRDDYIFALFRSGVELALTPYYFGPYVDAVIASNVVTLSEELKDFPSGIHLSLTHDPSQMVVMWTTKTKGHPVVQYGEMGNGQKFLVQAETTTYAPDDMCPGGPADSSGFIDPGMIHRAILIGLKESTNYSYRVGDSITGTFSPIFTFQSSGTDSLGGVRLLVMADMGTNEIGYDGATNGGHAFGDNIMTVPMARAIYEQVVSNKPPESLSDLTLRSDCSFGGDVSPWWCGRPTAVVHFGDLSYAVGYSGEWEEWMQQIMPYASRVPLMVQVGNHERNWNRGHGKKKGDFPLISLKRSFRKRSEIPGLFDWGSLNSTSSGGECGIPTETRFSMPGWPWGQHIKGVWGSVDREKEVYADAPWYGFRYGPVYFYMMSSEHDCHAGSPQHVHMEASLAAVNRTETPWVVVTSHRMIYVSSTNRDLPDGDQPIAGWLREGVEELFAKYGVDMGWYGHMHNYQRTCRVLRGVCLGSSGNQHVKAPIHIVIGTAGTGLSENVEVPPPPWIEYTNIHEWGYGRLWANSTDLSFNFVQISDGKVVDSLWLKKF